MECLGSGGGRGGSFVAVVGHVAISIACSADNFRASSARVPNFVALAANRLLIIVDNATPFVGDFNRVWN